jgi:hypothetical protein
MKIKRYVKGFLNRTDKFIVVEKGKVLYISRNYTACERYIAKHETKKAHQ